MSEYLGLRENRHSASTHRSELEELMPAGPVQKSYETYVKNIFHPTNRLSTSEQRKLDHGMSACSMLRVERSLGKHALSTIYDDEDCLLKTPLESLYNELGLKGPEANHYRQFPVYEPKRSSEYFAMMNNDMAHHNPVLDRANFPSYREKADADYKKNNRQMLVDYKDFDSSPLSPFLYRQHPFVRNQDSRIIGSNFVQVTSRPKDRFLEKVEKTLEEIRNMPRY